MAKFHTDIPLIFGNTSTLCNHECEQHHVNERQRHFLHLSSLRLHLQPLSKRIWTLLSRQHLLPNQVPLTWTKFLFRNRNLLPSSHIISINVWLNPTNAPTIIRELRPLPNLTSLPNRMFPPLLPSPRNFLHL